MNIYFILFGAIAFEILGTMLLPASENTPKPDHDAYTTDKGNFCVTIASK